MVPMGGSYRIALWASAALLALASIAHATRSASTERGWKPSITLTGAGDPERAVVAMRGAAELWGITLHHTEVDAATETFSKHALESLRDFNLTRLYDLLPIENGPFRELRVRGERAGDRYVVNQARTSQFEVEPAGTRETPGDTSFVLRSRGVAAPDGDTNYLMQARAGIVIGKIAWPMVNAANREWLRLVEQSQRPDPATRPMVAIRQTAMHANPKLGPEDVEIVATLWDAFPRMSYLASSLGRIDDVLVAGTHPSGATHIRLVLQLLPDRIERTYPETAAYLEKLGRLFHVELDWVDTANRTIASLRLDSETLQGRIELYVKDGLIVPFKGSQVSVDAPIDPGQGPLRYTTRMRSDFRMMGMYSHTRDGRVNFHYTPTPRGMELQARMTHVPTVTVDGAALGFIPASWVDAFIPGDLQSLITEFLTTACKGNEGRGVAVTIRVNQRDNGITTVDARGGFEALNNFLVKLGLRFFNDRVMPDADVTEETHRLMAEFQGAFRADLERFARAR